MVPRRTIQVHTVPRCSTEVQREITPLRPAGRVITESTVQTVCYVPTHCTTRNYTITPCTAGYYTKYTRYQVGLLSNKLLCSTEVHTVQTVCLINSAVV